MQSVSVSVLVLAVPFFGLLFFAIWRGCTVSAKFFYIEFKAEPKLEPNPKCRRRRKPKRPVPKPPPDEPG